MRDLSEWVAGELRRIESDMPFDLIVDKFIVDNLDLPLEVVYRKIWQKEVKRNIGEEEYNVMKVVYRIQGIFG